MKPRIRTIKPELLKHETLFDLEKETGLPIRIAWAGLFTVADREGRFEWRPRTLKAEILPYDEGVDFLKLLEAWERAKMIYRYEVDGETFGWIPTFKMHQIINIREAQSELPPPPELIEPDAIASHVPKETRRQVLAKTTSCAKCSAKNDLTIDHILPLSRGGDHSISNLQVLCRGCNSSKGNNIETHVHAPETHVHAPETHVHARVEGKGKEGNGTEGKEGTPAADAEDPPTPDFKIPGGGPFLVDSAIARDTAVQFAVSFVFPAAQARWLEKHGAEIVNGSLRRAVSKKLTKLKTSDPRAHTDWADYLENWFSKERGVKFEPSPPAEPRARAAPIKIEAPLVTAAEVLSNGAASKLKIGDNVRALLERQKGSAS